MSFLALNGIVKDLDSENDKLPPVLNSEILNTTFFQIKERLNKNKDDYFDFKKIYCENLKNMFLREADEVLNNNKTGWVIIPSRAQNLGKFKENVIKNYFS